MSDNYNQRLIYTPHQDLEIKQVARDLLKAKKGKLAWVNEDESIPNPLSVVANSTAIYVVGHGNEGRGIGTHAPGGSSDPDALAGLMVGAGLRDCACAIKLWACNSGVIMRSSGLSESYARRLAAAFAGMNFRSIQIFGYTGPATKLPGRADEEGDYVLSQASGTTKLVGRKDGSGNVEQVRAKDSKVPFSITSAGVVAGNDTHKQVDARRFLHFWEEKSWKIVPIAAVRR